MDGLLSSVKMRGRPTLASSAVEKRQRDDYTQPAGKKSSKNLEKIPSSFPRSRVGTSCLRRSASLACVPRRPEAGASEVVRHHARAWDQGKKRLATARGYVTIQLAELVVCGRRK